MICVAPIALDTENWEGKRPELVIFKATPKLLSQVKAALLLVQGAKSAGWTNIALAEFETDAAELIFIDPAEAETSYEVDEQFEALIGIEDKIHVFDAMPPAVQTMIDAPGCRVAVEHVRFQIRAAECFRDDFAFVGWLKHAKVHFTSHRIKISDLDLVQ